MAYCWMHSNNNNKIHADGGFGDLYNINKMFDHGLNGGVNPGQMQIGGHANGRFGELNNRGRVNMQRHGLNGRGGANPILYYSEEDMHDADDEVEDDDFIFDDADQEEEENGGIKKGPWSTEEDALLKRMVRKFKKRNWAAVGSVLNRTSKSCRLRWCNQISPHINHGRFTEDEDETIIRLHTRFGNRWADMARALPGRTDNQIKNHWHSTLSKRIRQYQQQQQQQASPQRVQQPRPAVSGSNSTLNRGRFEERNQPQPRPRGSTWAGRLRNNHSVNHNGMRQSPTVNRNGRGQPRSDPNRVSFPAPVPVQTGPHAPDRYAFPVLPAPFNCNASQAPPAADFVVDALPPAAGPIQALGFRASSDGHVFGAPPIPLSALNGSSVPPAAQFPCCPSTSTAGYHAPAPTRPAFDLLTSLSLCLPGLETDDVKFPNWFVRN